MTRNAILVAVALLAWPNPHAGDYNSFPALSGGTVTGDLTLAAGQELNLGVFLFAALPAADDGTIVYCSDCMSSATCTAGGDGAIAHRVNGAWDCGADGGSYAEMYQDSDPGAESLTPTGDGATWNHITAVGVIFQGGHLDGFTFGADKLTATATNELYKVSWNLSLTKGAGSNTNVTIGVWVDDGAGGGTADDGVVQAGEIRSCTKRNRTITGTTTGNMGANECVEAVTAGDTVALAVVADTTNTLTIDYGGMTIEQ